MLDNRKLNVIQSNLNVIQSNANKYGGYIMGMVTIRCWFNSEEEAGRWVNIYKPLTLPSAGTPVKSSGHCCAAIQSEACAPPYDKYKSRALVVVETTEHLEYLIERMQAMSKLTEVLVGDKFYGINKT